MSNSLKRFELVSVIGVVATLVLALNLGWQVAQDIQSVAILFLGAFLLVLAKGTGFAGVVFFTSMLLPLSVLTRQITLPRGLLLGGAVFLLGRTILQHKKLPISDPLLRLLLLFGLTQIPSLWIANNREFARQNIVQYAFVTLLFAFVIMDSLDSPRFLHRFVLLVIGLGTLDSLVTLWQMVYGMSSMPEIYFQFVVSREVVDVYRVGLQESAFGLFPGRGYNGMFLLVPACILIANVLTGFPLKKRAASLLLVLHAVAIFGTLARLPIYLLISSIAIISLLVVGKRITSLARLGLVLVLPIFVLLNYFMPAGFEKAVADRTQNNLLRPDQQLLRDRGPGWEVAWPLVWQNPVYGLGIGGLAPQMGGAESNIVHNGYLETLGELGVGGFALLLLLLFVVARQYRLAWGAQLSYGWRGVFAAFISYYLGILIWGMTGLSFKPGIELVTLSYVVPFVFTRLFMPGKSCTAGNGQSVWRRAN